MSGDARDFNNMETWAVINYFFFLQGMTPKESHAILTQTLGEHAPSYATVKNWVAQFKRGDSSTCDAPRPGRPKTPQIIDQIHELILEDRRIFVRLSVRTQINERFAENTKFQISVIIIISNILDTIQIKHY